VHSSLSYKEAVAVWIGRALNWKIRDLQKKYDVDPRRLYEVWEEEVHSGSRLTAMRICRSLFPNVEASFDPHQPRFRRTVIG
jgi:hypothetical protein